jgi:phage-related baseplate assembly protein
MTTLSELPDVDFDSYNVQTVQDGLVKAYQDVSGRALAAGDPIRLFLLTIAAVVVHQNYTIDRAAKQNLLKYATGDYLDQLGALTDTSRTPAAKATTTLTFTLSAAQVSTVTIPAGTRVTTQDKQVFFATADDLYIKAGDTTGTVKAACTVAGAAGNGLTAGALTVLVDPVPYMASVTNTETGGGADVESDDSYRSRIHEAPEKFSTAGPSGAYEYWAKTASADIIDVEVSSPEAGTVQIVPLLTGGEIPGQEVLDAVSSVCNADKVRPLTDKVVVKAPTAVSYDVTVSYSIAVADKANSLAIQSAVGTAVDSYITWQKSKLGRDIDPSKLYQMMVDAGASRVQVTSPTLTTVESGHVATCGTKTVTFAGVSSE